MRGSQLRAARAALDLNQGQLADLAFVNRNTVHRYETLDLIPDSPEAAALIAAVTHDEDIDYDGRILTIS